MYLHRRGSGLYERYKKPYLPKEKRLRRPRAPTTLSSASYDEPYRKRGRQISTPRPSKPTRKRNIIFLPIRLPGGALHVGLFLLSLYSQRRIRAMACPLCKKQYMRCTVCHKINGDRVFGHNDILGEHLSQRYVFCFVSALP